MKVLITGITGMVGSVFAKEYRARGNEVWGLARNSASSRMEALDPQEVIRCDILERDALERIFDKCKPDVVIHMAAQAFNSISWDCEYLTHNTNYIGTLNVLKCALKNGAATKVLLACSSAEYGDFDPGECPLKENRCLRPVTPYGVSKVGTELLGYQYYSNYGLPVYLPRMFIHIGAGHPPATAVQNFARQLALIAAGKAEGPMRVGNLEAARDMIDVRDGVRAMMLLLEKGEPGQAVNICAGRAYKMSEILEILIHISGLDVEGIQDAALLRASDELLLLGDNSKIKSYGFAARYSIEETLEAVYRDWLARV